MSFCSEQFLFLDPVDTNGLGPVLNQQRNVTSPKRTIQVNQARTPGGTLVTTTTMTTERPRDQKHEAPVDGRRVTYFYVCITSLDQNYIHLIETAQDRILVFSLTNTNKEPSQYIQGSPSLWNIDSMFYAIELDEYDWISKKIYTCIYILSSSSIFRY